MTPPANPPKKRLGQHFLTDPNTARIVAEGTDADDVVLEVGPGRGFLTAVLARQAKLVHAVELDPDVLPALRSALRDRNNVRVYEGDALRFDYDALVPLPNKMIANLPYNVASPLILKFLEDAPYLEHLRFMVQLEVARRMTAARGTKDYSGYAALIQLLARATVVHKVSPKVFDPPPRVYSAVVDMQRRKSDLEPSEYSGVKELVLASFKSRRKRLLNNLPGSVRQDASSALTSLGYGPNARAEELAPEDFVALHRAISEES